MEERLSDQPEDLRPEDILIYKRICDLEIQLDGQKQLNWIFGIALVASLALSYNGGW